jgi:two-component system response regulator (stage 0 sporulation protein F)
MSKNNKITVLYVDDEMINLELFQMTFKNTFEILTAESGKAGLEIMQNYSKIQVVISDMKMPEMSGIEFITEAKKIYQHVSFLILTGFDINNEIKESLKSGLIIGYFQKPLNRSEITNAVLKAVE